MRFDIAITELFEEISRSRAVQRIKNGDFTVNGRVIKKPSCSIHEGDRIEESRNSIPFVSRGGLKLEAALQAFDVSIHDQVCMDVGASTGGFTQCLLNHGAKYVYAIDVGDCQLNDSLRSNARIQVMENRDIRSIDLIELGTKPKVVVADVSFISIRKIWLDVLRLSEQDAVFLFLFKPQFETEKKALSKGGIVRNPKVVLQSLRRLILELEAAHYYLHGMVPSPIQGKKGNVEFLLHIEEAKNDSLGAEEIEKIVFDAYQKGEKK
jgi:23S rRNA (cytidine1920-2'-O)/16S rRNA (cytidine1409-2'-O)-methyltransferase